ncbi:PEP-CTERM sorting domain-containing protein [Prosthecobacter sp.]|jgi:opacity protein-like surface antigen|uniref:PEP-CTERM sorting domain-containing protein n=1 Tax=Prosthecobacter sp. TaxID=1965333 RepID=UPI0037C50DF6
MKKILSIVALAAMCASSQAATVLSYSFTSDATPAVSGGSLVGTVSAAYAYIETVDANGDPLSLPSFRPDLTAPAIAVGDPSARGYGAPISGNALDAVDQAVLFSFSAPQDISAFALTLDNSTLGTPFGTNVEFYDSLDALLYSILVDQTVSGFSVNQALSLMGVSKVVLPSGAFYDNASLTVAASAVPEPSRVLLMGLFAGVAVFRRRRA